MPIHQTKLTMSTPQPTGMLMPQRPTPTTRSFAIEIRRSCIAMKEMPKARYHHFGVLFRTTALILSVTEAGV